MSTSGDALRERSLELAGRIRDLSAELNRVILGQDELIADLLIGLLAGGHVLLEGLPGLGKTRLVQCLAAGLGLQPSRVQFTPDLMPADVTGTRIVDDRGRERVFRFEPGPIFGNIVLADEINRATPRTQSALLEAMQEGAVTVAGERHALPRPFAVIATQNPIELEGTYPLPEAQLDRFLFKLEVRTPDVDAMVKILAATTSGAQTPVAAALTGEECVEFQGLARQVVCGDHLLRYVAEVLEASHPERSADEATRRLVRYGASARAGQAVILGAKVRALLDGRPSIQQADIDACLVPALRHRIVLTFEAEAEGASVAELVPAWSDVAATRAR